MIDIRLIGLASTYARLGQCSNLSLLGSSGLHSLCNFFITLSTYQTKQLIGGSLYSLLNYLPSPAGTANMAGQRSWTGR